MPRPTHVHKCTSCGATALKWAGRCPSCGEWNTLVEVAAAPPPASAPGRGGRAGRSTRPPGDFGIDRGLLTGIGRIFGPGPEGAAAGLDPEPRLARPLSAVDALAALPFPTDVIELDRVLAGGIVPGSISLLGGEPGIGKSTLVLQVVVSLAKRGLRSLIVAAEESAEQVRRRAERLGACLDECFVLATCDLFAAIEAADQVRPSLLVIDSIQTLSDPSISSPAGTPNQVRECAQLLAQYAKATRTATVLVGHVTKDGVLAGPRTLEHLVDTVLSFEGDRHHSLRVLTSTKHRFGPSGEVGLFEMCEEGLTSLDDPGAVLLGDRRPDAAGSVAVPAIEGRRPLLVEVQSLVAESHAAPRRVVQGVTPARVTVLLAVLERYCYSVVGRTDVFVSTVGGLKITEPASDLAVAAAVASALTGVPIPLDTIVFGEVGLSGEVRQVARAERRLEEAARLGFVRAIVPPATPDGPAGMRLERVASVREAMDALGISSLLNVLKYASKGRPSSVGSSGSRRSGAGPSGSSGRSGAGRSGAGPSGAGPSRRSGDGGSSGQRPDGRPHLTVLAPIGFSGPAGGVDDGHGEGEFTGNGSDDGPDVLG